MRRTRRSTNNVCVHDVDQLIGDTIEEYGGDLKECVWVQYNTLKNRSMFKRYEHDSDHEAAHRKALQKDLRLRGHDDFIHSLHEDGIDLMDLNQQYESEKNVNSLFTDGFTRLVVVKRIHEIENAAEMDEDSELKELFERFTECDNAVMRRDEDGHGGMNIWGIIKVKR